MPRPATEAWLSWRSRESTGLHTEQERGGIMAVTTTTRQIIDKPVSSGTAFDVGRAREDFPILKQKVHGKPLVYFDNAATSQKPAVVIEAEERFYKSENSNIHRGVHELSERATRAYEDVRVKIQKFINARETREIVFVRG